MPVVLNLDLETRGNATRIKLSGKLVAGSTEILYDQVKPRIVSDHIVILDLTNLSVMDSLGLGTLLRLYVSSKTAGCDLRLINLSKRIRELLTITNLLGLFEVYGEHPTKIV